MLFYIRAEKEKLASNREANKKKDAARAAVILEQLRKVTAANLTGVAS